MTTNNILLIDDHAMFRSGLRMVLLAGLKDAEIFEAGSLNEAMEAPPERIDIILLDISLPGLNGLDGIALIKRKWPQTPVIVLSSQDGPKTMREAVARGAICFISKADTADRIITLINRVLCGEYNEPKILPADTDEETKVRQHLTSRQCEVLDLLCQGMSNKLIARKLSLSEHTVRGHVQSLLGFLQVSSRSAAIVAARRRGLIG
jgi:DNA-binding NarL/FixJ family response regulator